MLVTPSGPRLTLRRGTADDVPALEAIRREPEVARWWGRFESGEIAEQFVDHDEAFVIELEGAVIGAIQFEEEEDPMYRHAGIDLFVSPSYWNRGLGAEAVRTLARYLFAERGHHRLTIDPAADNERAIRAYERVGFRRVGVMRRSERGADGTWHDGVLMDLLADELNDEEERT